jgi:hypothetical protein
LLDMGIPLSRRLAALLVHAFAAVPQEAAPTPAAPPADVRVQRWREDLAFLAKELPARHKNLFFQLPKQEFEAAVEELDEAVARRSDGELVVDFMRLVASAGVAAHNFGSAGAEGLFHEFSGWVVFVLAFLMMLGLQRLLQRFVPDSLPPRVSNPDTISI